MADVTLRAFAGVHNRLPAERLRGVPSREQATVDLAAADNVDLDDSGMLRRRPGTALKVAGAAHSLWADGDDCLFVAGTSLYRLHPDYSRTLLASNLALAMPAVFARVGSRIYWTNGVQTGVIEGNASRAWGVAVPNPPALTAVAGQLAAGTYAGAITYVRADGQESGCALPTTVTLTAPGGVRFAWPAVPAGVTDVVLYLTEANGMQLYQAATVAASAGSATITGGIRSRPCDTQWLDAPPPGQCLTWCRGRLYIAAGPYLFATTALGYELCDLRDFLNIDNTAVTLLQGVEHGLFVGTGAGLYFVAGDRLDEATLRPITSAPAIAGSNVMADGLAVTGRSDMAGVRVCLMATAAGVVMGLGDGSTVDLTHARYRMAPQAQGAAVFRADDALHQYLLFDRP